VIPISEAIKRIVFDFVLAGGTIGQVREGRERYRQDFPYYYKAIIPLEGFPRGLFVEMRLVDGDDPEYPIVHLVNAHPQQGAR